MKAKVTAEELKVPEEIRPKRGEVYEAKLEHRPGDGRVMYFIKVGDAQIGLFENECEVVEE